MANRIVYKYILGQHTDQTIVTGQNPIVRSVQVQDGAIYAWIEVDSSTPPDQYELEEPKHPVSFRLLCTGETFDNSPDFTYLGTLLINRGSLVVHVYYSA